jgi:hypothetical protein
MESLGRVQICEAKLEIVKRRSWTVMKSVPRTGPLLAARLGATNAGPVDKSGNERLRIPAAACKRHGFKHCFFYT